MTILPYHSTDKVEGSPANPNAVYFVLRLDMTEDYPAHVRACRYAMYEYIAAMRADTHDEGGESHYLDKLQTILETLEKQDAGAGTSPSTPTA